MSFFLLRFQVLSSNIAGHKIGQNGPVTFYAYSKLMSIYTTSCVTEQKSLEIFDLDLRNMNVLHVTHLKYPETSHMVCTFVKLNTV